MAAAVLVHLAVTTLAAMVLGLISGRMTQCVAVASLVAGTCAGLLAYLSGKEKKLFPGVTFAAGIFYAFIIFAGVQHFLYLLYYDGRWLKTLHPNNAGDLSMHIQYIRNIASGAGFWPMHPGFAGTLLKYPIGMDLYNALWEILGVAVDSHLFLAGVIMTAVAISVLRNWAGWWGVGAFFLNGGLANWRSLFSLSLHDYQNSAAWKNFFLSLWITQRGFLFALPAGVYVFGSVMGTLLGERTLRKDEKIVVGLLWSALAWFHLHSFFIITLTLVALILLYRKWMQMSEVLLPVALTGLVFVLFSTEFFYKVGIAHIQWGWVAGNENALQFWVANLGPWLVLWAASIFLLIKKSFFATLRPAAAVFFILFFIFTFVIVTPWDWDNIKVLLWPYLFIAWIVWRTLIGRLRPVLAIVIGCVVFLSGAVSVISSMPGKGKGVPLYLASELWDVDAALLDLPRGAVLAIAPEPGHPAMFHGANVAMGFPGHIWSHAIDGSRREKEVGRIFRGGNNWLATARSIGVTHIYWGDAEKRKYGAPAPSLQELKNISRSPEIAVYEVPGM